MGNLAEPFLATAAAVAGYGVTGSDYQALSDDGILRLQQALGEHQRHLDAIKTQVAGQLARRSRPELGHHGLAAREGFRNPAELLQTITGATSRQAHQLVNLGKLTDQAEAGQQLLDGGTTELAGQPVVVPWEAPITTAVAAGKLSADQADALRRGLGCPSGSITATQLRGAAIELLEQHCHRLPADRLFRQARSLRDLLDEEGIPAREAELHAARSFKAWKRPNGMIRASWDLDPEGGAYLLAAIDPLTAPRRGGPRFVDPAEQKRAQDILDDPRSNEQINSDALLQLIRLGSNTAPDKMYGKYRPVVKILVTQPTLTNHNTNSAAPGTGEAGDGNGDGGNTNGKGDGDGNDAGAGSGTSNSHGVNGDNTHRDTGAPGFAVIEGNPVPVSPATAARLVCAGDTQELTSTPDGGPLDLGRTKRLFNKRQHDALAARDGGCMWPECDRPPSWSEAHHIDHYQRDHGNTNIADGICLCRFHHLTLHNNGWQITRTGNDYWLIPPARLDPDQEPIPLPTKNLLTAHIRTQTTQ